MSYTVIDRRGKDKQPASGCRVCGSSTHECSYNQPSMKCIEHLRARIRMLEEAQKECK